MTTDTSTAQEAAAQANKNLVDKAFLGPEFLTWLYFHLLAEEGEIALPDLFPPGTPDDDAVVSFAIGKRILLKATPIEGARVTLAGIGLADNGEVLSALRRGALIMQLALELKIESRVYSVTLDGEDGGFRSLKLPDLMTDPNEDESPALLDEPRKKPKPRIRLPLEDVLAVRMQCLDEVERVIDTLFARFVTRRLARAWGAEDVAAIRERVIKGLRARTANVT